LEKNNDDVIGIHLIKTDLINRIGHCSIIGVLDGTKGSGIGSKLWDQALGYWSKDGINKCMVPFSLQNLPSFNFHLKIGFNKAEEVKNIYHYRKNKKHENSI
jgi:ribosomal protein S18 acetylase RimI-like enzyme